MIIITLLWLLRESLTSKLQFLKLAEAIRGQNSV